MGFQTSVRPSKSDFRHLAQHLINDLSGFLVLEEVGVSYWLLDDLFVDLIRIVCVLGKRNSSAEEFIETDPNGPKINGIGIPFACNDFGGHVMRCSDDGEGPIMVFPSDYFRRSHINEFQKPLQFLKHSNYELFGYFFIDHDVLGFDVTVDD